MSTIFKNPRILISTSTAAGANDISASVTKAKLESKYDMHDNTRMGLNSHSRIAGLEDWSMEFDVLQAFSTSDSLTESVLNIDRLLATLKEVTSTGKSFLCNVRMKNGVARSSDNPEYEGLVVLETHQPFDAEVGDLLKTSISLLSAGDLSRYTSSS